MVNKKNEKKPAAKKTTPAKTSRISTAGKKSAGTTRAKISEGELFSVIQRTAYDLYMERGCTHGGDQTDWYRAESLVKGRAAGQR